MKSTINKIRQTLKNLTLKTFIGKSTTAVKKKKKMSAATYFTEKIVMLLLIWDVVDVFNS